MLPRAVRLRRNGDFQAVYSRRRSWAATYLVLYIRDRSRPPAGPPSPRFGFVISKKVAKRAHVRNQIKRRLAEICRVTVLPSLPPRAIVDVLFVARTAAPTATFAQLAEESASLLRQAGLMPMASAPESSR